MFGINGGPVTDTRAAQSAAVRIADEEGRLRGRPSLVLQLDDYVVAAASTSWTATSYRSTPVTVSPIASAASLRS